MTQELALKDNFQPREWQKKCLSQMKRFSVIAVHRRAGKTTVSINILKLKALQKVGLYAYIAPELKQAKLIAWKALKDACQHFMNVKQGKSTVNLCEFRESELTIKFWNGSEIRLFGADNPDSLRGSKLAGAVIDEVAQMPKELWLEIVYPALMDSKGFAVFIGTPKGINLFSDLFDKGNDPVFKGTWSSQKFTCYETDALDPEDIEQYKRSVPEEVFRREMLCDFTASGSNQLIPLQLVELASHKGIDEKFMSHVPMLMGVDVARFGDDSSTIMCRRGILAYEPLEIKGLDLVHLADVVINQIVIQQPHAVFVDGTGVGGGLVDILNNKLFATGLHTVVFDVNFGRKSTYANFVNKRTEMWAQLKAWLEKGGIIPNDDNLKSELAMPTYEVNDKNQIVLESKKQIRDRLGRSPDKADALALTFAETIVEEDDDYQLNNTNMYFKNRFVQSLSPFERFERERGGYDF